MTRSELYKRLFKIQTFSSIILLVKDLLRKMLTMDPQKRIKLKQVTEHPFFENFKFVEGVILDPLKKIKIMDKYWVDKKMISVTGNIRRILIN